MRIEPLDLLARAEEVHAVQRAALATVVDATGVGSGVDEQHYERHAARDGFRAVAAWDDGRRRVSARQDSRERSGTPGPHRRRPPSVIPVRRTTGTICR